MNNLITIQNCRIEDISSVLIPPISWKMNAGEAYLVIGPNGGGKAPFVKALVGELKIIPNSALKNDDKNISLYSSVFGDSVEIVSLEKAATLIEEERNNDESEYLEGGVDHGRTGRVFLCEALLGKKIKKNAPLPSEAYKLDGFPEVK